MKACFAMPAVLLLVRNLVSVTLTEEAIDSVGLDTVETSIDFTVG